MSIKDSKEEYNKALVQAHKKYPLMSKYNNKPEECYHNFSFCIFCDGGKWDIMRCNKCGSEKVAKCNFDEDYD